MRVKGELVGLVVHWHSEEELGQLIECWPDDPRFGLVVVDNGSNQLGSLCAASRSRGIGWHQPEANLGFAGGIRLALEESSSPLVLLLNPDVRPAPGALEALLLGCEARPDAAGLAPRMLDPQGQELCRWQLRPLVGPVRLALQGLLLPVVSGPRVPPPEGTAIPQPAAAALALRRSVLEQVGGLDVSFHPAWFEDVDLASRLAAEGHRILYWPRSVVTHVGGSSVPQLGYGDFLWIYYRNLSRYLEKHAPPSKVVALRPVLALAATARILALPVRASRRAGSRRQALSAWSQLLLGILSGWRHPRRLARVTEPQPAGR